MKRFTEDKTKERGLTLFELLVVLAILALLATVIAPRVVGYLGRAKSDIALSQATNIASSLELFYFDMGRYPTPDEGLAALVNQPAGEASWRGPYLKEEIAIIDPWGEPYGYEINPDNELFKVTSFGRDKAEGGDGEDADIIKR